MYPSSPLLKGLIPNEFLARGGDFFFLDEANALVGAWFRGLGRRKPQRFLSIRLVMHQSALVSSGFQTSVFFCHQSADIRRCYLHMLPSVLNWVSLLQNGVVFRASLSNRPKKGVLLQKDTNKEKAGRGGEGWGRSAGSGASGFLKELIKTNRWVPLKRSPL